MLKLVDFLICVSCAADGVEMVLEAGPAAIEKQAEHMVSKDHRDWDVIDIPPSIRNAAQTAGILKQCITAWIAAIDDPQLDSYIKLIMDLRGAMSEALRLAEESY